MKPGDFVKAAPPGGFARDLKAWSAWNDYMQFFTIPYGSSGTVVTVLESAGVEWSKVLFPQGVGWVSSENLELLVTHV